MNFIFLFKEKFDRLYIQLDFVKRIFQLIRMAQVDNECPICIETFTLATRKEVICPYCNYKTCIKCMKQHILNQQSPNCMNCHIEFNREFIDLNMTKNFRTKELKQHRENILLEREKSLLPATIVYAEQEKEKRRMEKDCRDMEEKIQLLEKEIDTIRTNMRDRRTAYYIAVNNGRMGEMVASTSQSRRAFVKACVVSGCRGFLSTQYKCGICDTWVCPDCHEVKSCQKDEQHTCNPETVESVKLIVKETKPCPKCGVVIYKSEGCHQMWCTECHTTFDWATGRETITTNIHNPHYYEWVRRNNNGVVPRNPLDIPHNPCGDGRLPQLYSITRNYPTSTWLTRITSLLRILNHIRDYDVVTNHNYNVETENRDLRIKYLLNEVTEEVWKKTLQQREKKWEFKVAKSQVCEMIITVAGQYLNEMANTRLHVNRVLEIEKDLEKIVDYYNESMKNVLDRFNSKAKGCFINRTTWGFANGINN